MVLEWLLLATFGFGALVGTICTISCCTVSAAPRRGASRVVVTADQFVLTSSALCDGTSPSYRYRTGGYGLSGQCRDMVGMDGDVFRAVSAALGTLPNVRVLALHPPDMSSMECESTFWMHEVIVSWVMTLLVKRFRKLGP